MLSAPMAAGPLAGGRRFVMNPLNDEPAGPPQAPRRTPRRGRGMDAEAWRVEAEESAAEAEENAAECQRLQQAMQEVMQRTETVVGHLQVQLAASQTEGAASARRAGELESRLRETRPGYADYVERTSAFFPWKPKPPAPPGEAAPTEA